MKVLLCVGEGLGNVIQVLPLAKTLSYNNIDFDILNLSNCNEETVSWLFKKYAKVVSNLYDSSYDSRIEIATTKGVLKHSERLAIPLLNDIKKQFIYKGSTNEIEIYLSITNDLGFSLPKNVFDIGLPEPKETDSYDFIVHNGCSLMNKTEWQRKKYPHMEKLIERLIHGGYTVACIGSNEEYCGGDNLAGLPIKDSAGLISNSKFFIANDTGTYHLASAMKHPGIVLFTATSTIKNYHPTFHRSMKVLTTGLECQPCQYTEDWARCTEVAYNKWKCREIPVETIIKEIKNANIF
jgi:ADP-heptose:LPS heptosyltransferase